MVKVYLSEESTYCECGGTYTHNRIERHKETKRHKNYMLMKNMMNNMINS